MLTQSDVITNKKVCINIRSTIPAGAVVPGSEHPVPQAEVIYTRCSAGHCTGNSDTDWLPSTRARKENKGEQCI